MNLPADAENLISLLNQCGYKAYAVGGCVRDFLMNRAAGDVDITTSAKPLEVESVLSANNIKFVETGLKHGTVTAVVNHVPFEITTFRTDGEYKDSRHPEHVVYVRHVEDDLARRDFTINAIAYNKTEGFIDEFGGIDDIQNKLIRCVGDPDTRFKEDALRIMRAVRFSSVLGFEIEEQTKQAIFDNVHLLDNIAAERIYTELVKLLLGDNAEQVLLEYKAVIAQIIPEFKPCFSCVQNSKWHLYDVYTHIVKSVVLSPRQDYMRLAVLLHDIGKPQCKKTDEKGVDHFKGHPAVSADIAKSVLKRLKVSNDVLHKVVTLVEIHDSHITQKPSNIKKWLRKLGDTFIFDFIDLKIADMASHNLQEAGCELEELKKIRLLTQVVLDSGEPYRISDLAINGRDLTALGYSGKAISSELENLIKIVSGNPVCNTKEKLLHQAKVDKKLYIQNNENSKDSD